MNSGPDQQRDRPDHEGNERDLPEIAALAKTRNAEGLNHLHHHGKDQERRDDLPQHSYGPFFGS
ncbi:hypothetical protein D3C87_1736000 [compost metagenome]